jgi:Undecaprenyl-phosphate glucose phosphotransferase
MSVRIESPKLHARAQVLDAPEAISASTFRARAQVLVGPAPAAAKPKRFATFYAKILGFEFIAVASAAYASSVFYQYSALQLQPDVNYVPAALFIAGLVSLVSIGFRQFIVIQRQPLHVQIWNGIGAVALAFSFFLSMLFLLKISGDYSRGAFVFQIVAVGVTVCITRTMSYFWMQSAASSGLVEARHVVLIGEERFRLQFDDLVRTSTIRSVASLPFPHHRGAKPGFDSIVLIDSKTARKTIEFCRSVQPDDIVILASPEELSAAPELARLLSELPVNVHIVPLGSVNVFGTSHIAELGDLKTLQVSRPPLSPLDRAIKRAFDILVAAAGLILFAPLFAIVAIAIKLESRGNVFFWQKRHGYNNTTIDVVKFRTMFATEDDGCFIQARPQDTRVTHVGRLLRRTNIDELPQLFNVLIGNMSIVGPRPHATAHNEMFEGRILPFSRRHNIKPGITGWAQVSGHRGETDTLEKMQRRVEHDLYYIDNWSFLLDMKIILLTLFSKRAYRNAY